MRPTWRGPLLLFGSPILAVGCVSILAFPYAAGLMPLSVTLSPYTTLFYLLAWVAGGIFAAIGSSTGGSLLAGNPRSWWRWPADVSVCVALFAGAVSYAVLSAISYVLLVLYVLTFRWT